MKRTNISAFIGLVCCFLMMLTGIATNGGISTVPNFLHIPSMIITFGGVFFSVLITTESSDEFFKKGIRLMLDGTDPEL